LLEYVYMQPSLANTFDLKPNLSHLIGNMTSLYSRPE
jgi:hypothetical protein